MSISKNNCPVPFDQQPLNEYLVLKKSWFFSWSIGNNKQYIIKIIYLFISLFIFIGLLMLYIFINNLNHYKLLLIDLFICDIIVFIIFMRLYLGWSYILKRLLSATIFYEESGWYDGQVWIKKHNNLIQDRLVGLYEIMPYINRIKLTCIIIMLVFLLEYFLYFLF
uniref:Ycf36 n=1 Tax=Sonderella linearis TaxID=110477 RepID=A0A1Z1MMQ9_9FLOR|nr:hypothetical protein [Sonderella linearis]ARW67054.1 hypothetical protein [Sonderella linearis]